MNMMLTSMVYLSEMGLVYRSIMFKVYRLDMSLA